MHASESYWKNETERGKTAQCPLDFEERSLCKTQLIYISSGKDSFVTKPQATPSHKQKRVMKQTILQSYLAYITIVLWKAETQQDFDENCSWKYLWTNCRWVGTTRCSSSEHSSCFTSSLNSKRKTLRELLQRTTAQKVHLVKKNK